MKAYLAEKWCSPSELLLAEVPTPEPQGNEVLIKVEACGMNFPDILLIGGKYQARPKRPFSPGAEVAGTITAIGTNVQSFSVGDRVVAVTMIGGYAQYAMASEAQTWKLPEAIPYTQAAGMMVTYQTAYLALVERARTKAGEKVLVLAAAGGIGTASIQIAKALGAHVIGAAGSEEKLELAKRLGSDEVLNYKERGWAGTVRKKLGGADVVIDPVGGDILLDTLKCANFDARLIIIGFTSGTIPEIPANMLLLKNISAMGLHWNLYLADHPKIIQQTVEKLFLWYEEGKIQTEVARQVPMTEAREALEEIGNRTSRGKYVLLPWK